MITIRPFFLPSSLPGSNYFFILVRIKTHVRVDTSDSILTLTAFTFLSHML